MSKASKRPKGAADDLLTRIEAMLERMASEFGGALAKLDGAGSGPRVLARQLGADPVLCHRLLAGIRSRGSVAERLAAWPGVAGLRALVERMRENSNTRMIRIEVLERAVDEYARLVDAAGGSQARLVRDVRSLQVSGCEASSTSASTRTARRSLYRAAGEILGYEARLVTHISAIRPIPGQPELIEGASVFGLLGLFTQGGRICVTSSNVQMRNAAGNVAGEVRWTPLGKPVDGRDGLLPEFCSSPSLLTATDDDDGYIRQMVDMAELHTHGRVDLVLGRRWSPDVNPQYTPSPIWSHVLRMRHPSSHMLFDAYVHKSMLGAPPEIGAYLWHPGLKSDPRAQWHDRFPVTPAVQVIPPAPTAALSESWDRQGELTDRLFELVGWDRREFAGFRCDDRSPIWSAAYYMTFDLKRPAIANPTQG